MSKFVYIVTPEGKLLEETLVNAGYEIYVGNGTLEDWALAKCDAIVPGKAYITEDVLRKAPNVKVISKFGVGVERIDIEACTQAGVVVANTPTNNYVSVAEHTMMLILAAAKRIIPSTMDLRMGTPDWVHAKSCKGQDLEGKILLLVGLGNIGKRVAKLANAFEMKVIAYDPYVDKKMVPSNIEVVDSLDSGLAQADFVSLHVVGIEQNRYMVNADVFRKMKKSAVLVNTTRGFVVDEAALIEALENGEIAGAALDVFEMEPIACDHPLLSMPNVVITPHAAGNTQEARLRGQISCANNIMQCFDGKRPDGALN